MSPRAGRLRARGRDRAARPRDAGPRAPPQIQSLSEPRGTCRPRVEVKTAGRVGCLECRDRVGRDRGRRGYVRQRTPIGPHELEQVVRLFGGSDTRPRGPRDDADDRAAAGCRAWWGRPGPSAGCDGLHPGGRRTPGSGTSGPGAGGHAGGRAGWCGCGPRSPPCGRPDRAASPLGWASDCQVLRRSRGNVAHLFQLGLAGLSRIRQHGSVDVDHDLIALARCSRAFSAENAGAMMLLQALPNFTPRISHLRDAALNGDRALRHRRSFGRRRSSRCAPRWRAANGLFSRPRWPVGSTPRSCQAQTSPPVNLDRRSTRSLLSSVPVVGAYSHRSEVSAMPESSAPAPPRKPSSSSARKQRLPGGVLGTSRYAEEAAFVVKHGKGSKIYDVSGREYIDYVLGLRPAHSGPRASRGGGGGARADRGRHHLLHGDRADHPAGRGDLPRGAVRRAGALHLHRLGGDLLRPARGAHRAAGATRSSSSRAATTAPTTTR